MKLLKLQLQNFRKFAKAEFDLSSSAVLIYGPNEAGKSTIHQGILAALFGIGAPSAGLFGKEKLKSQEGGVPRVALEFTSKGKEYKIERDLEKSKAKLYKKSLSDYVLESEDLKTVNQFVLKTLGVSSAAIFNKTASIQQADVALISDIFDIGENLEKIFAGEGNVSLAKFESELEKIRKSLKKERNEKPGELDKLYEQRQNLLAKYFDAQKISSESQQLSEEVEQLKKLVPELEARVAELDALILKAQQKKSLEQKRNELREQWKIVSEKLNKLSELKEKKTKIEEELGKYPTVQDLENQSKLISKNRQFFKLAGFWASAVLSALFILFAFLQTDFIALHLTMAVIFSGLSFSLFYLYKKKTAGIASTDQLAAINKLLVEKEILERSEQMLESEADLRSALENLEFEGNIQNKMLEAFADFEPSTEEIEKWKTELLARRKELQKATEQFHFSRGVLKVEKEGSISPEILAGELNYIENLIKEKEKLYSAIQIALATVQEIKQEYHGECLPVLEKQVSELFAKFTSGNHKKVLLAKSWPEILVEDQKGNFTPESLSRGTLDQLYFAFRLAAADMLSQNVKLPLIFDDPLVHFDKERAKQALDTLSQIAKERQIIFFSHDEELCNNLAKSIKESKLIKLV
jgi:uncharacterized protein YhaN